MFCSSCGKQINDGAKFCGFCGATQVLVNQNTVPPISVAPPVPSNQNEPIKEGQTHKCPYCGEILGFDALVCPSCGNEIRGKKSLESINDLVNKVQAEPSEEKKIELIKLYPIPNTREAIFEFMVVAASKFDPSFYASNPTANSIAGAWYTQIELCYKKGKMMFKDASDLARLEQLYNAINEPEGSLTKEKKKRKTILLIGVAGIAVGVIVMFGSSIFGAKDGARASDNPVSSFIIMMGAALLAAGIIVLVKGLKKKKTAKELEIEAQAKKEAIERKDRLKREAAERNARR